MARFEEAIDRVLPWAPECPEASIEAYVKQAAIELLRKSGVWRPRVTVKMEPGRIEYRFPRLPSAGRVKRIAQANYMTGDEVSGVNTPLAIKPLEDLIYPTVSPNQGDPRAVSYDHSGPTLHVWPAFRSSANPNPRIELRLVAVLTRSSEDVPDDIWEGWSDAFVDGALYYLLKIPGKPWTQPEMANERRFEFYRQVNEAQRAALQDGGADRRFRFLRHT